MGAVGITRTFVTLNNDYRVQTKSSGATVSTVSMSSFWRLRAGQARSIQRRSTIHNDRFIVVAVSDAASNTSSVEFGVSTGPDPNGSYYLFRRNLLDRFMRWWHQLVGRLSKCWIQ
jgi:hypothetical protein